MEIDESLLELYRSEVDTHMATLNDRLLALERDPAGASGCAELMRAAHSIKGAARIMGLQGAVDLSHGIEDCFVGVGRGQITLTSDLVDVLLEGVDLLQRVTQVHSTDSSDSVEPPAAVAEYLAKLARRITGAVPAAPRKSPRSDSLPAPATTESKGAGPRTLSVGASLDTHWVAAHRAELVEWQLASGAPLQLDLSAVERVDVVGALLLARLHAASGDPSVSGTVHWLGPSPRVRRFLESAGLAAAVQRTDAGD